MQFRNFSLSKGLLQHHLDVLYMDNESRSLHAEQTWNYIDTDEDNASSDGENLENPERPVIPDTDLNNDAGGVDTMEHMSGKHEPATYSAVELWLADIEILGLKFRFKRKRSTSKSSSSSK